MRSRTSKSTSVDEENPSKGRRETILERRNRVMGTTPLKYVDNSGKV
jgi:hypothetical protein